MIEDELNPNLPSKGTNRTPNEPSNASYTPKEKRPELNNEGEDLPFYQHNEESLKITIIGLKNSGKTTLLYSMLEILHSHKIPFGSHSNYYNHSVNTEAHDGSSVIQFFKDVEPKYDIGYYPKTTNPGDYNVYKDNLEIGDPNDGDSFFQRLVHIWKRDELKNHKYLEIANIPGDFYEDTFIKKKGVIKRLVEKSHVVIVCISPTCVSEKNRSISRLTDELNNVRYLAKDRIIYVLTKVDELIDDKCVKSWKTKRKELDIGDTLVSNDHLDFEKYLRLQQILSSDIFKEQQRKRVILSDDNRIIDRIRLNITIRRDDRKFEDFRCPDNFFVFSYNYNLIENHPYYFINEKNERWGPKLYQAPDNWYGLNEDYKTYRNSLGAFEVLYRVFQMSGLSRNWKNIPNTLAVNTILKNK